VSAAAKPRSLFLPGVIVGLLIAAIFGALLLAPLLLLHRQSFPLEEAYGAVVVDVTTRVMSAGIGANPYGGDARALRSARDAYIGSCSPCHGPGGNGRGLYGPGTYPTATNLTSPAARALGDAQLFYIIKSGLGFTGMPAYASQYPDREIWGLVAYVRAAQVGQAPSVQVSSSGGRSGGDARRGAEIYVAQGCATCHGVAPGQARVERNQEDLVEAIRRGRPGMPRYTPEALSDAELADLSALVAALPAGSAPSRERGQ